MPTACLQNVASGRIARFLKSNRIANRECSACNQVKGVRRPCGNYNTVRRTSDATRVTEIGSKSLPKCEIAIERSIIIRWPEMGDRFPCFSPDTRRKK
jgi:hypothetical protein